MITFPNCKINLGLNVIEQRSDGFHNIETIMYPVKELYDSLEIIPSGSGEVRFQTGGAEVDCPADSNLAVRAYRLMQAEYGIVGAEMYLRKNIPSGAGLGGGSADAAFAISMADRLYGLNLSVETLEKLAARLGSDTSFFIRNEPQLCVGRGEITEPINVSLSGMYIVIIKPPFGISTAEAYGGIKPKKPAMPISEVIRHPIAKWRDLMSNDFETHLFELHPRLKSIKSELYESGALYASMSGSGSAMYAIFDRKPVYTHSEGDFVFISRL